MTLADTAVVVGWSRGLRNVAKTLLCSFSTQIVHIEQGKKGAEKGADAFNDYGG